MADPLTAIFEQIKKYNKITEDHLNRQYTVFKKQSGIPW